MKYLEALIFFLLGSLLFAQSKQTNVLPKDLPAASAYELAGEGFANTDNDPSLRLIYAMEGLQRAEKENNALISSRFAANVATVYTEMGLHQEALKAAQKSHAYSLESETFKDDIWSLFRLSEIHSILKDSVRAFRDANRALALSQEQQKAPEIGWSYIMLGEIYRRNEAFNQALEHYEKALSYFKAIDLDRGLTISYANLGVTHTSLGHYEDALLSFDSARYHVKDQDIIAELEQGLSMAIIIQHKYSLDSAISYALKKKEIALLKSYPTWLQKYLDLLADLQFENENWNAAWAFHLASDSLKEVQTGERVRFQNTIADHEFQLQLLHAEQELQAQQNRNKILLSVSILLVLGLLGIFTVTQITKNKRIKRINERLSEKNQTLDELIKEKDVWMNLMAHDLKAPLNSIKGLLTMIKSPELPAEIRDKAFENISKSIDKGSTLISQLLEISRLESGDVSADLRPTDIRKMVLETVELFQPMAERKSIDLKHSIFEQHLELETDPVYVQRILENLVSNALKFSPSGKEVLIQMNIEPTAVNINVVDEGPGMSEQDRENLFQKFKKLSARPTGGESSTGLGLSIVKQLADQIDARILVHSTLGKGTTFTLSLPREKDH